MKCFALPDHLAIAFPADSCWEQLGSPNSCPERSFSGPFRSPLTFLALGPLHRLPYPTAWAAILPLTKLARHSLALLVSNRIPILSPLGYY